MGICDRNYRGYADDDCGCKNDSRFNESEFYERYRDYMPQRDRYGEDCGCYSQRERSGFCSCGNGGLFGTGCGDSWIWIIIVLVVLFGLGDNGNGRGNCNNCNNC